MLRRTLGSQTLCVFQIMTALIFERHGSRFGSGSSSFGLCRHGCCLVLWLGDLVGCWLAADFGADCSWRVVRLRRWWSSDFCIQAYNCTLFLAGLELGSSAFFLLRGSTHHLLTPNDPQTYHADVCSYLRPACRNLKLFAHGKTFP